jgi:hypothetical protein
MTNEKSAVEILLPQVEVKTLRGERIVVEPWGLTKGKLMLSRLESLFTKARGTPDAGVADLIEVAYEEFYGIVRDTLEWSDEEMERKLLFEDLLALAETIWNLSVSREDGGGVGGKLGALLAGMNRTADQMRGQPIQTT